MAARHNVGLVDKADQIQSRETIQEYITFLDDSAGDKVYTTKVEELIKENSSRLIISVCDLRQKFPARANALLMHFVDEVVCLEQAVKEVITRVDYEFAKDREFFVGFEGTFANNHVNPRSLKSEFLGRLICCEGIVTRCSLVRPKIVKSVHYCPATNKTMEKKYTDFTSYEAFLSSNAYPKEDENKNPLETEFGLSTYKDHQVFSIQELPESAPPGHLPRSVDVIADDDLADRCKPGDRLRVIGLYRVLPNKQQGMSTGNVRTVIISNNILLLSKEMQPNFEPEDVKNIRRMSRHKDIFELLARSLAPSIYGHDEVKKAILCLLLGGSEKLLENGTRLRGDVNVLLIGDPSVAKSQLLRYVIHTAPRVIATTGRGSSGVGLTAAVVHDSDSGERRLEAGAMVLADRGIVCIDEFDKMSDIDRTAIHEVMEQGRVSISKAGIHAKLNARCSVLAAANPVYGRYNLYKTPMENIGMQDSLLSRFDLIFVLLDEHNIERDHQLADNVLKLHRYRTPGEPDGTVLPIGSAVEIHSTFDLEHSDALTSTDVYEKNRKWTALDDKEKILSTEFLRKYIHMAKNVNPKLTVAASEFISEHYSELRSTDLSRSDRERTMPVTARQLETMIRLSTAMAKARLATTVELADAQKAYDLLYFACFKEKPKERLEMEARKKKGKKARPVDKAESDVDDEEVENIETLSIKDDAPAAGTVTSSRASRHQKRRGEPITQASENAANEDDPMEGTSAPKRARKEKAAISVDRYKKFKGFVRVAFDELGNTELVPLEEIRKSVQKQAGRLAFSESEFEAAFEQFNDEGACMIVDDEITLI